MQTAIDDDEDYIIKLKTKRSVIGIEIMSLYLKIEFLGIVCKSGLGFARGEECL